jgi:hypothetical protein
LPLKGPLPYGLYPQLMLRFTCYKGTFSTFVFASQNRSFTLGASHASPLQALQAANAAPLYTLWFKVAANVKIMLVNFFLTTITI